MSLVKKIARGIAGKVPNTVDPLDLESAGTIGLIRAVDLFDPDRGVPFEAFASHYVRGAVLDHLRALDPLPYSTRSRIRKIEKSYIDLERETGRTPSDEEVSRHTGIDERDISRLLGEAANLTIRSLQDDQDSATPDIPDKGEAAAKIYEQVENQQLAEILVGFLGHLPERDRLILSLYYFDELKMKEIAELFELTESRVSQLHSRAITILRARMRTVLEEKS